MKLKKCLSVFLAALLLLGLISMPVTGAQTEPKENKRAVINNFKADTYSVVNGKSEKVTFTAQIASNAKLSMSDVIIRDDDNNYIAAMHDDGKNGDKVSGDGIFTAVVSLQSSKLETVSYHVTACASVSASHPIKYRNTISDSDFEYAKKLWTRLENYENELAKSGFSAAEIANLVYDYLVKTESDNIAVIKRENDRAFSFMLKSGIENYFEHIEDNGLCDENQLEENVKALNYIQSGSIGVWCPYYGLDSNFTMSYSDHANMMKDTLGYDKVDCYYASDASVNSFKNFDRYGVILIDSHGLDYNGGGYIAIPRPGSYSNQDIADGHLVMGSGFIGMRGTFMEKYCDTLKNPIIYTGICYGLAADNLYGPWLNHGAALVAGYDESVSFTFDGIIVEAFCKKLVSVNPSTLRLYTAGEAYNAVVRENGDTDPYGGKNARFICYGNRDVIASPNVCAVESVRISPSSVSLYLNNTYKLNLIITPQEANRYTTIWTSSSPDTVHVDSEGNIKALKNGQATINCKVTDESDGEGSTFNATCNVTVDGSMPVSGIEVEKTTITLYEGTGVKEKILASVVPENASNQELIYTSADENIAKIYGDGYVAPVSKGKTYVTVTTEDGNFSGVVIVNVVSGNINAALNKSGGDLVFSVSGNGNKPDDVSNGKRYFVQTMNHDMNSTGIIALKTISLKEGDELIFDWKVSSEITYDAFRFIVNGEEEAVISGERDWNTYTYIVPETGNYTFKWQYSKDYSTNEGDDCGWLDEVEVISERIPHTVTFLDMDGKTVIDTQTVKHGESAKAPAPPVHHGYAFFAWDGDYTHVRGDVEVVAMYIESDIRYYTVTFLGMNDEIIAKVEVEEGKSANAPEPPEVKDYVFAGWDADISKVTEDMTVHAVYMLLGDANCDGKITTGDAVCILRHVAELQELPGNALITADMNKDGNVNTGDAVLVLRKIVGLV